MPSLVAAQGGSQTATLIFDAAITSIVVADVTFTPNPGIASVTLSADKLSALVVFSTPATSGATYTITVAATVSTPPLTNTTITTPLLFSGGFVPVSAESGLVQVVSEVSTFLGGTVDISAQSSRPVPEEATGQTLYLMRAYSTPSTSYVWWTVGGSPDFTGLRSPYPFGSLTDIVLEQTICN